MVGRIYSSGCSGDFAVVPQSGVSAAEPREGGWGSFGEYGVKFVCKSDLQINFTSYEAKLFKEQKKTAPQRSGKNQYLEKTEILSKPFRS